LLRILRPSSGLLQWRHLSLTGLTPTSGFIQKTPDTGQPVSERTEVYIAYTGDTLYFGVVCYDREPDQIVVADRTAFRSSSTPIAMNRPGSSSVPTRLASSTTDR